MNLQNGKRNHLTKDEGASDSLEYVYAKSLRAPILGKHFKLPGRPAEEQKIVLDTSLPYIPVYAHLKIQKTDFIKRPPTPPNIRRIASEDYMDFYRKDESATAANVASNTINGRTTMVSGIKSERRKRNGNELTMNAK